MSTTYITTAGNPGGRFVDDLVARRVNAAYHELLCAALKVLLPLVGAQYEFRASALKDAQDRVLLIERTMSDTHRAMAAERGVVEGELTGPPEEEFWEIEERVGSPWCIVWQFYQECVENDYGEPWQKGERGDEWRAGATEEIREFAGWLPQIVSFHFPERCENRSEPAT